MQSASTLSFTTFRTCSSIAQRSPSLQLSGSSAFFRTTTAVVLQQIPLNRHRPRHFATMAPQLPTRQLGKNGPQVTAQGFGLMGLSAFYGKPLTDEERFPVLDRAYEIGAWNWDTADMYMDNEDLIGKWFKRNPGKRDNIFLATKFASTVDANGKPILRNDPPYVRQACERSLSRLGVDHIDLYYCHRFNGQVPAEDIIEAMVELKNEGKIRYIGISECSADTLRRCHSVHPITAVQVEYSPWSLDIESEQIGLLKAARELGVSVVAYSPLGRGFLTGQYKSKDDFEEGDFRKMAPRFNDENFPKNLALVEKIKAIAARKGCTSGQLTLAWLMAQGPDIVPIPGTKKIKYLEENFGSLNVTVSPEEEKEIRKVIEDAEITGGRYPEFLSAVLFGNTPPRK